MIIQTHDLMHNNTREVLSSLVLFYNYSIIFVAILSLDFFFGRKLLFFHFVMCSSLSVPSLCLSLYLSFKECVVVFAPFQQFTNQGFDYDDLRSNDMNFVFVLHIFQSPICVANLIYGVLR